MRRNQCLSWRCWLISGNTLVVFLDWTRWNRPVPEWNRMLVFHSCCRHPPSPVSLYRNRFFQIVHKDFVTVETCLCSAVDVKQVPPSNTFSSMQSRAGVISDLVFSLWVFTRESQSQEVRHWPCRTLSVWYVFLYLNRALLQWLSTRSCTD